MGAFCCCPCREEFEEYTYLNGSVYRHCICLRYFFHQLISGYTTMFQRLEGRTVFAPIQGTTSLASAGLATTLPDNSSSEIYHSCPRPMPYDTDPRYSRLQRDGLVSRREKSSSHLLEESQPLRCNSSTGLEALGTTEKWSGAVDYEGESKAGQNFSDKIPSAKALHGVTYILSSTEHEDVCPTCLEEYTAENPKIMTQCSHHFHLGCIYEWMERSENCPLCGKEMAFSESL